MLLDEEERRVSLGSSLSRTEKGTHCVLVAHACAPENGEMGEKSEEKERERASRPFGDEDEVSASQVT